MHKQLWKSVSVVTRDRLERFLDWIQFEHLGSRGQLTQEDAADLAREVRHAVRERPSLYAGSASSAAATAAETVDGLALWPKGEADMDDPLEHLYFMSRVERGLRQIAAGRFVSHEEAKRRFGR
jgi:hypothetical protein